MKPFQHSIEIKNTDIPSNSKVLEYVLKNKISKVQSEKLNSGNKKAWRPNIQQKNQMKKFSVICKNCGYKLAEGLYWKDGKPNFHYTDLEYFYEMNVDKKWKGVYGINRDPKTNELRFECQCGNNWKIAIGLVKGDKKLCKGFTFQINGNG